MQGFDVHLMKSIAGEVPGSAAIRYERVRSIPGNVLSVGDRVPVLFADCSGFQKVFQRIALLVSSQFRGKLVSDQRPAAFVAKQFIDAKSYPFVANEHQDETVVGNLDSRPSGDDFSNRQNVRVIFSCGTGHV